jgi:hypothetical protein
MKTHFTFNMAFVGLITLGLGPVANAGYSCIMDTRKLAEDSNEFYSIWTKETFAGRVQTQSGINTFLAGQLRIRHVSLPFKKEVENYGVTLQFGQYGTYPGHSNDETIRITLQARGVRREKNKAKLEKLDLLPKFYPDSTFDESTAQEAVTLILNGDLEGAVYFKIAGESYEFHVDCARSESRRLEKNSRFFDLKPFKYTTF